MNNIIVMPFEKAWKMRAQWAKPGGMEQKRTDITMRDLEQSIRVRGFQPIDVEREYLEQGLIPEGKHRLIIAKKLGIKEIPIRVI